MKYPDRSRCRVYPDWVPASLRDRCRTIYPWILLPDRRWFRRDDSEQDAVIAHELVHISQQRSAIRFWAYWVWRYLLSRRFRLAMECEAIAAELEFHASDGSGYWSLLVDDYAIQLSGPAYGYCADSFQQAKQAILNAVCERPYTADRR